MIGYTMLGTNDLARARRFYDPLAAVLGAKVVATYTDDKRVWYATNPAGPLLAVGKPHDGAPAGAGNGTMVALPAANRAAVDAAHAEAMKQGGTDEGAPGLRGDDPNGFYGAYFRDPDGNKICVFKIGPA